MLSFKPTFSLSTLTFIKRDDQNVANARIHKGLDGVINHRLVVHGKKMLVSDLRQWVKATPFAAGENNALHQCSCLRVSGHDSARACSHRCDAAFMKVHDWNSLPSEQINSLLSRRVVHTGRMTIAKLVLTKGAHVPTHSHENEQVSMVESGRLLFRFPDVDVEVGPGQSM